ncbi:MAG: DUF4438 domain-containing protein [Candidatus Lindowbacteria bacterium RIFCSPLOWO2_12_FULL_62_27]|nr:MAG: DUF4438 domain-containing protein [Candidatus Lindowbacteria bacterium RIFCSPLOWO2_12_FULL_62_27]OGH61596.1 MAG: DUF4438 domain-containing protein [Candidatus Lindowbacteria bacterium RIFCSPLOWO2_02_FULL_62_12]
MTLKMNESQLIEMAVQGSVIFPRCFGWEITHEGEVKILPSVGGITYNVLVGDSVYGWAADHIEPCVSTTASSDKLSENPNRAFNAYACIGNTVTLISGAAKSKKGVVTGHHGGVEHVIVDFPPEAVDKMTLDDKLMIRAVGQGLRLVDHPDITLHGIDPGLVKKLRMRETGKYIQIPVAAVVPGALMGSGLGHNDSYKGDYDIQTSDPEVVKQHRLDRLRLGDVVAIQDHKSAYGWSYKKGAVTIAVVIHGDSSLAGHGPGVQTVLTSPGGWFKPTLDPNANIGRYLGLGRYRKKRRR